MAPWGKKDKKAQPETLDPRKLAKMQKKSSKSGHSGDGTTTSARDDSHVPASLSGIIGGDGNGGNQRVTFKEEQSADGKAGTDPKSSAANSSSPRNAHSTSRTHRSDSTGGTVQIWKADKQFEAGRKATAVSADDTELLKSYPEPMLSIDDALEPKPGFDFVKYRDLWEIVQSATHGQVSPPEIVVVGAVGVGKSALIEALVGHPINDVAFKAELGCTRRPVKFQLTCDDKCDKPKLSYTLPPDRRAHAIASPAAAASELSKLNDVPTHSSDYVNVQFSFDQTLNLHLIDTPGLNHSGAALADNETTEAIVLNAMRPPHRLIVCVEEAAPVGKIPTRVRELVADADPTGSRTMFVVNKVRVHLEERCQDPAEATTWFELMERIMQQRGETVFTSLLSSPERQACIDDSSSASFYARIAQSGALLKDMLQSAGAPEKIIEHSGVESLRTLILDWARRRILNHDIPRARSVLTASTLNLESRIDSLENVMSNLNLKQMAVHFGAQYLQLMQTVLSGTVHGTTEVNGEDLQQERDASLPQGSWECDPTVVPGHELLLYGGQQLERLFADFNACLDRLDIDDATVDIAPSQDQEKYAALACDAAHSRMEELVLPLVEGVIERCGYIMGRLPAIVDDILDREMRAREAAGGAAIPGTPSSHNQAPPIEYQHYAPLTTHIADRFQQLLERQLAAARERCVAELYDSKTIYWHAIEIERLEISERKEPGQLLREVFTLQKARVRDSVRRKLYAFFIRPFLDVELWNDIQTHLMCLPLSTLEEIFELPSIEEQIDHDQQRMETEITGLHDSSRKLAELLPVLA